MKTLRALLACLALAVSVPAAASFHLFVIQQLYSNADGTIQFVQLRESTGSNNEEFLGGHPLISSQGAVMNTLIFPGNLPSGNTANRSVLIATPALAAMGVITPDYIMPAGFLFTNGGSLNYAGVDNLVYSALPTDGVMALYRNGTIAPNLATNFAGATASITATSQSMTVVEYHHAIFDHYFITPVPAEIALLDAHAPPFQDWSRTGFSFNAYANATAPAGSVAICRFFNDHFAPKSSHFYAAHGFGCEATLSTFPDWSLEDAQLFNTLLPDAITGACPAGTIPVFRLYNNGMGGAPNHRFVTDASQRQAMINQGWTPEGAGIGVGMCVPG